MQQVSTTTAEKHRLEDTICRLKTEALASATSLSDTLEQLEREKKAAVSDYATAIAWMCSTCRHVTSCDP